MSEIIEVLGERFDLAKIRALPAADRMEAEKALAALLDMRVSNPLAFYKPNGPKYHDFHMARQRLRAILGGNRSGKTTLGIVDDIIQATPWDLLPAHLRPYKQYECPFYCRIMTPDMERTMRPVIHQKLQEWMPKALFKDGRWDRSYMRSSEQLYLECGCRFDFLAYTMDVDKFGGAALHRCHYDEEPPEAIRNECLMRLIDFDGDELYTFTPLQGLSWSHKRIFRNRKDPRIHFQEVSTRDNVTLSQAGIARAFDDPVLGLSANEKIMREEGRFHNRLGFVYPDARGWVVPRPDRRTITDNETLICIDPGIRVAGLVWLAYDGHHFLAYDFRELEASNVRQYREEIDRVNAQWGLDPDRISYVVDPAAQQRSLATGESVLTELNRQGIYPELGNNDVDSGILLVNRLGEEGRFLISDALEDYIDRMAEYPIERWADGTLHPQKTGEEHVCDATRYGVSVRAWGELDDLTKKREYGPDEAWPPGYQPPDRSVSGMLAAGSID